MSCRPYFQMYTLSSHSPNVMRLSNQKFLQFPHTVFLKLSITLDTFPTRIMKRNVQWQPLRRIFATLQQEKARQWTSRSCGCSSEIPPDHEFQFLHCVMFCLSAPMIKQFFLHLCPNAFTSRKFACFSVSQHSSARI